MAPRQRTGKNKDLPTGLHTRNVRGKLRYFFIREDGTEKWFPTGVSRADACAAAYEYNRKYRYKSESISERGDKYNKPLSEWLPEVTKRISQEEKLGSNALSTLEKDIGRLQELHGNVMSKRLNLEHVNEFLDTYCAGKSNNVYNRKISFLKKIFDYLCDMSAMDSNPAALKKVKPKEAKVRQRLTLEQYQKILKAAPNWLNIAMRLALQTTHAVLEVSRIKYRDCTWFDKPDVSTGLIVYGVLRIHRQKVATKEASRVAIPITPALKSIIDDSRDNLLSPYVVHRLKTDGNPVAKGLTHETQLTTRLISSTFSQLRDELGVCDHIPFSARPTFHEIRALAIHLYTKQGVDPQARAAHTDSKSTKIYQSGHVNWVEVPAAELSHDMTG
ncbi:tyrosine-type recombinase/integrase [Idiomarina xiamenensis]|uniref:Integrase n=1 Tax=Idiomarina xiamenensis 10-D-4 TaxID=740709 RepID=K2K835_9GAMM|nr:tyrosine-type recombinase/integrase [Idiomarina xiamenensis]EKE79069.1 integrase [Idiomarina xiamenensis 10-D-4]